MSGNVKESNWFCLFVADAPFEDDIFFGHRFLWPAHGLEVESSASWAGHGLKQKLSSISSHHHRYLDNDYFRTKILKPRWV